MSSDEQNHIVNLHIAVNALVALRERGMDVKVDRKELKSLKDCTLELMLGTARLDHPVAYIHCRGHFIWIKYAPSDLSENDTLDLLTDFVTKRTHELSAALQSSEVVMQVRGCATRFMEQVRVEKEQKQKLSTERAVLQVRQVRPSYADLATRRAVLASRN